MLALPAAFGYALVSESPPTEADLALQEEVERLVAEPINVNRASVADLLRIPWLSPLLAQRIVAARDSTGQFASILHLKLVSGMTPEAFEALVPVLTTGRRPVPLSSASLTARARTDSFAGGFRRSTTFSRAAGGRGRWRCTVVTEKDRGEIGFADYVGASLEFGNERTRVAVIDYGFGASQGLVFSRAEWRSSYLDGRGLSAWGPASLGSAVEASRLRGAAVQVVMKDWRIGLLGSRAGRDARLNGDGTVAKLLGSGVHDDSEAVAGRNALHEVTGGIAAECRAGRSAVTMTGGFSGYDRDIAPSESAGSLFGRALCYGSLGAAAGFDDYRVGLELAGAGTGGIAGLLDVDGEWDMLNVHAAVRGRQRRFFAPHGRWTGTYRREDRLDVSGRLGFRRGGFAATIGGNTYRDFDLDSIPARIEGRLRQELGILSVSLDLERRFESDIERSRRGRLKIGLRPSARFLCALTVADAYPDDGLSRGRVASVSGEAHIGPAGLGVGAARFDVGGRGISMYVSEPGPGVTDGSYSTSSSGWRLFVAGSLEVGRWLRLGVKTGCQLTDEPTFDLAAQLGLEAR